MQPRTWPLLLLSPLALLLSPPRAHSASRPSTGPAPAWVRPLPVPAALEEPEGVHGGVYFLLLDRQTRAGLGAPEQYTHIAEKLTTPAGVESGSQVRIVFDPEYEQVALHFVRVIRGGRPRDVLDSTEVQVLRQEAELERQLFNGQLTALLILKDLRVGDVVEYAWTRRGANPTFEGHIAYTSSLASQSRIERIAQRLLVPKERSVRLPRDAAARDSTRKVESSAFLLTREERVQAREASIRLRYRSLSDSVPAEAMAEHLAALKEGRELLSFVAQAPALRRGGSNQGVLVPALSAALVLVLLVGLALAPTDVRAWWAGRRARARRRRFALGLRDGAGESAATAVEVRDLAGAFEYAGRLRCQCGRPWTPRERPREEDIVVLDGKAVLALALGCEPCARQRRLFVRLQDLRLE